MGGTDSGQSIGLGLEVVKGHSWLFFPNHAAAVRKGVASDLTGRATS